MQEKYFVTSDNVKEILNKFGVAIIPNILSEEECDKLYNEMWDYFEHITRKFETPLKRDDEQTWVEFFKLYPMHGMLIQHHQVGHAQFAWNVRQNIKIVEVFAKIWKVKFEELLVSFDGSSFHLPHEVTKRGYYRGNDWFHTDQNFVNLDECVQSWVTAKEVREGDATLTFLEGSHKYHADIGKVFAKDIKKPKDDWYKINDEQKEYLIKKGCTVETIKCPAGSLVLWNSKTFHAGKEPLKNRTMRNFRTAVYLCYTPRSLIKQVNLKKKHKAFKELRSTTHWPHKVKLFPVNPWTHGQSLPPILPICPPVLSPLGMTLAGF